MDFISCIPYHPVIRDCQPEKIPELEIDEETGQAADSQLQQVQNNLATQIFQNTFAVPENQPPIIIKQPSEEMEIFLILSGKKFKDRLEGMVSVLEKFVPEEHKDFLDQQKDKLREQENPLIVKNNLQLLLHLLISEDVFNPFPYFYSSLFAILKSTFFPISHPFPFDLQDEQLGGSFPLSLSSKELSGLRALISIRNVEPLLLETILFLDKYIPEKYNDYLCREWQMLKEKVNPLIIKNDLEQLLNKLVRGEYHEGEAMHEFFFELFVNFNKTIFVLPAGDVIRH